MLIPTNPDTGLTTRRIVAADAAPDIDDRHARVHSSLAIINR